MSELENSLEDTVESELEGSLEESLLEDSSSTLEEDMKDTDFVISVSKYDDSWMPSCLFNGFNTKVILKDPESKCLIEKGDNIERLKKRLEKDVGEEGEDWIIDENPMTGEEELYLRDDSVITMWLIRAAEQVKTLIREVHNHQDE